MTRPPRTQNKQLSEGPPGRVNPRAKVRPKRKARVTTWRGWGVLYPLGSAVLMRTLDDLEVYMEANPAKGQRVARVIATCREVGRT